MDAVKAWANRNGLNAPGSGECTHLLLNGGRLCLGEEWEAAFLRSYARWLEEGRDLFVVERRTRRFRFFVDIDYVSRIPPSNADLVTLYELVEEMVASACQQYRMSKRSNHPSMASMAKLHTKDGGFKRGLHVVFPDVVVDTSTALVLRKHIIRGLEDTLGDMDWESAVDATVYTQAGLRMIGSKKAKRCGCETGCRNCNFSRYRAERSTYVPMRRYENTLEMVLANSIRTFGDPEISKVQEYEGCEHEESIEDSGSPSFSEIGVSDGLFSSLKKAFPDCFSKGQRVTKVLKVDDHLIVNCNSKYCYNLGREHKGNNVYFYVDKFRMYQRCFCRCPTTEDRKHGMCKDFRKNGGAPSESVAVELSRTSVKGTSVKRKAEDESLVADQELISNLTLMPREMAGRMLARAERMDSSIIVVLLIIAFVCMPEKQDVETFKGAREKGVETPMIRVPAKASSFNAKASDKANDYIRRFYEAYTMFAHSSSIRVRRRAYDAMLMLSAKAMKHLTDLRSWFPNDLELDTGFRAFADSLEIDMHRKLQLCARLAYKDREDVYVLDNVKLDFEAPVGANFEDYIK